MDDETPLQVRRFQKIDVLILGLNLVQNVAAVVADTFEMATHLVAAHANYNVERERFREDAAREIETITGENDG